MENANNYIVIYNYINVLIFTYRFIINIIIFQESTKYVFITYTVYMQTT